MNREEAIKWVDALSIYLSICDDQSLKDNLSSDIEKTIKALDMVIEAVKAQEWIPCSERLPSDSGNYLITGTDFRLGYIGEPIVTTADFYAKAKKWNSIVDVVAWMPRPKPYKAESEE